MKTDKSSKFAVTDRENYLKMGEDHTKNDREVTRSEIREKERVLNGHSSMWVKMLNIGENHNHQQRFRESVMTNSNNLANMYLILKDHK